MAASTPTSSARAPRHLFVRFLILGAIVAGGFAALRFTPLRNYLEASALAALLDQLRGAWWAPLALLLAYIVLLPIGVPASPLMLAGGAVFGVTQGFVWNFLGTFAAGVTTYFLGRLLGRDFVRHFAGERLVRLEKRLARRGFWGLVGIRFLPFPFTVLNYGLALVGVRPPLFLTTTALGLAPPVLLYTWFAAELSRAAAGDRQAVALRLALALGALAAVIFVPRLVMGWKRRERLARLRAERAGRRTRFSAA